MYTLGKRLPFCLMHQETRLLMLITAPLQLLKSQEAVNTTLGPGYQHSEHIQRTQTVAWSKKRSSHPCCDPGRNLSHRQQEVSVRPYLLAQASSLMSWLGILGLLCRSGMLGSAECWAAVSRSPWPCLISADISCQASMVLEATFTLQSAEGLKNKYHIERGPRHRLLLSHCSDINSSSYIWSYQGRYIFLSLPAMYSQMWGPQERQ